MHSLLSTAQAKWKAWDQACYTPVFMGALSSLTVTYMHTFVLIISTHALDTCPIFILSYKRRKKINTEPDKPNSGDRTIISAPSISSAVWHKWQWLSILPFLLPRCPCFSNFKVFSQVGEWHCFPAPWFPWMRSARLPWGRGAGGSIPLGGRSGGLCHLQWVRSLIENLPGASSEVSYLLVDLFCRSRRVLTAGSRRYGEMNCSQVLWWFRLGAGFCVESLARFCSSAWKDYNGMLLPEWGKWAEACWKAYQKAILERRLHCSSPGKQKGCASCSATSAQLIGINLQGSNAPPEITSRSAV